MKTKIEVELKPFTTPNFVLVKNAPTAEERETSLPLSALDSLTLDRLCNDFRNAVFNKAGKEQPPTAG